MKTHGIAAVVERCLAARGKSEAVLAVAAGESLPDVPILITGAAGSVGSALAREIAAAPGGAPLVLFDHDDTGLQRLLRSDLGPRARPWLGDVRDERSIRAALATNAVRLVVHCAAVKHVDLLQQFPREAVRTNVLGTACVLRAAAGLDSDVHVVNVSSDKAATARCVLGASKRLGERAAAGGAGSVTSVRLGNVLDSRGSVVEAFIARAAAGLPLRVTDPLMTRYVMTTAEVVALVAAAAKHRTRGAVFVPDLGAPVTIGAIADAVLAVHRSAAGVVIDGPRAGDAPAESLIGRSEPFGRGVGVVDRIVAVPPWAGAAAVERLLDLRDEEVVAHLAALAVDGEHRVAGRRTWVG